MKRWYVLAVAPVLFGCASTAPVSHAPSAIGDPSDQKPELQVIKTYSAHDYRYLIYGDPVVAPQQAFSDGQFLYLQLKPEQVPPLAYTRSGDLIEYEVTRQIVKMPKIDSVVLRIGPRKAYVDHKDAGIVPPNGITESLVEMKVERPAAQTGKRKIVADAATDTKDIVKEISASGAERWTVCHAASVNEAKLAAKFASAMKGIGISPTVKVGCGADDGKVEIEATGEN